MGDDVPPGAAAMTADFKPVPLLVTVDVEIAPDRCIETQAAILDRLRERFQGSPATWFATADAAERFSGPLRRLARDGHEIGCHGLDHSAADDYRSLSAEEARMRLEAATTRIEQAIGVRPRLFRGPRMTTSAATQRALRALGYAADFSVCSRRLDVWAASRYEWRWIGVGPRPYVPLLSDPYRGAALAAGDQFRVVPLSGWLLPFVSGMLFILGSGLMRFFAERLERLARRADAPLVYLFHSYEFVDVDADRDARPWHHRLYPGSADKRFEVNQRLLHQLLQERRCIAMTGSAYLKHTTFRGENHGPKA